MKTLESLSKSATPLRSAALVALAVASLSLAGCGGTEAENTTCGEFKKMSVDERIDILDEQAEAEDTAESDQWKELSDDDKKLIAEAAVDEKEGICAGHDDDTKLGDI